MARELMTDEQIAECVQALRAAFRAIQEIQSGMPGGQFLQLPRLPSLLTESIIAREIRQGRSTLWPQRTQVRRGGKKADLIVEAGDGTKRIEVKATGRQGFEYLGDRDIASDALVWLHFGGFFEGHTSEEPLAYWLPTPSAHFSKPVKISLQTFIARSGGDLLKTFVGL